MADNPELDAVLAKQDLKLAVAEFFQDKIGSDPAKAEIASRSLVDNFKLTGASLMFGDKLARDAVDDVIAHLKRQNYAFLLPDKMAVDEGAGSATDEP